MRAEYEDIRPVSVLTLLENFEYEEFFFPISFFVVKTEDDEEKGEESEEVHMKARGPKDPLPEPSEEHKKIRGFGNIGYLRRRNIRIQTRSKLSRIFAGNSVVNNGEDCLPQSSIQLN